MPEPIQSLAAAVEYFHATMQRHPERDMTAAYVAAMAGKRRRYPVLSLNHLAVPDDPEGPPGELVLPEVTTPDTPVGNLAREIIGMLAPLKMLNPVVGNFGLGLGPGTMVPNFGISLNPKAMNCPAFTRSLDDVLADAPPDAATSGLMPPMRERIRLIKDHVPDCFKIELPDMQGPFNLAHAIVGEEILTAPYLAPEKMHRLLTRITDFWIETRRTLVNWIGEDRLPPTSRYPTIAECSVNLVSPAVYEKHILKHDLRIMGAFGYVCIHPCSGPHVFHVTLKNIPNVIRTEAGFIDSTIAGAISVDEALEVTGDRPIALGIGQELPPGREEEVIRRDLDRYATNPRLTFGYTGMHWRRKDRPMIDNMHCRLDAYWEAKYG